MHKRDMERLKAREAVRATVFAAFPDAPAELQSIMYSYPKVEAWLAAPPEKEQYQRNLKTFITPPARASSPASNWTRLRIAISSRRLFTQKSTSALLGTFRIISWSGTGK